MAKFAPFTFQKWTDENRHLLKRPVGAKTVFEASETYMIFVVGGPKTRTI